MPKSISQSLQETRERLKLLKEVQEEEMNREEIKKTEETLSEQGRKLLDEQIKTKRKFNMDGLGRNVGGRPSKLNEDNFDTIDQLAKDYIQSALFNDKMVTRAGLCCWLSVNHDTLKRWEEKSEGFCGILKDIDVIGENQLAENSKNGTWNALFCKFMLSAKYHYREKSDITSDNKGFDSFMLAHKENEEKEA